MEKMTAGQWDWLPAVTLHAPIRLTCALLPLLLSQPEAHVLNVCSIDGLVVGPPVAPWGRPVWFHVK
jgi:short-subunit dehydrogenase involved in D-alanine esterification of teichoic acids